MTAPVDPRTAAEFETTLYSRVPGYLPGWEPEPGGAGSAMLSIAARFAAVVTDRLNRAPEKNELAFFDMLGVSLLPAQAARAPIAFALRPGLGDSRAPAGTQVGATVDGVNGPLIYETERDVALAAAHLVEVATVLPGEDRWADHTAAFTGYRPFTLFEGAEPVGHELYIAHDVHFALDGHCEVQVQLELATAGSRPVATIWEYWDGTDWRPFAPFVPATQASDADSIDGTSGLTRSGTVVLRVEGASAKRLALNWIDSYWIRARAGVPLTPDFAPHLPTVDRILISTLVAPPMGSLIIVPEPDKTSGYLGTAKTIHLYAGGVVADSPDPAAASVSLTPIVSGNSGTTGGPEAQTRSLTSGQATFGPVTATTSGKYEVQISVPGFTALLTHITLSDTAAEREFLIGSELSDRRPDKGAASSLPLDLTKPFYPFGASPQPGSTFYLASDAAYSKPGAKVTIVLDAASTGLADAGGTAFAPTLDAEYYDGESWQPLDVADLDAKAFTDGGTLKFDVPADVAPVEVNSVSAYWIRIRVTDGTFGQTRKTTINGTDFYTHEVIAPAVQRVRLAYYYRSPRVAPSACHTRNDFAWVDHSAGMAARGAPFPPFTVVQDATPALYFGFDAPLPTDVLSLYVDIEEVVGDESGPILGWECADGDDWVPMTVEDETAALALPGTVRIAYPGVTDLPSQRGMQIAPDRVRCLDLLGAGRLHAGDHVSVGDDNGSEYALIAEISDGVIRFTTATAKTYPRATVTRCGPLRFGTPRPAWIRARLRTDGDPRHSRVDGVHPNTAWAAQVQTRRDEILGTSDGNPEQSFTVHYPPVLPGQVLEVLELSGQRAAVDLDSLRADVILNGGTADDLRVVTDNVTGAISQIWVRWSEQRKLFFSRPADRHYAIERSGGLVLFGDDRHGRIPPTATDGIHMAVYRSGLGRVGNVAAGAINQLLSGIPAASVINVRAAEGGADIETRARVLTRGPASVAARSQAVTAADYEVLAREASPAVALARALPATDPQGRPRPGFVRLIIMPDSPDPRPVPSFGLRRQVEQYVRLRCPASMAEQVFVVAPDYQPVGVFAEIVPLNLDAGGPTVDAAIAAARSFLHPLRGGPDGTGWAFGRDVYLSDLARAIGGVPGVDLVRTLELLLDDAPSGQLVQIPGGRIVVAGPITIRLAGGE